MSRIDALNERRRYFEAEWGRAYRLGDLAGMEDAMTALRGIAGEIVAELKLVRIA